MLLSSLRRGAARLDGVTRTMCNAFGLTKLNQDRILVGHEHLVWLQNNPILVCNFNTSSLSTAPYRQSNFKRSEKSSYGRVKQGAFRKRAHETEDRASYGSGKSTAWSKPFGNYTKDRSSPDYRQPWKIRTSSKSRGPNRRDDRREDETYGRFTRIGTLSDKHRDDQHGGRRRRSIRLPADDRGRLENRSSSDRDEGYSGRSSREFRSGSGQRSDYRADDTPNRRERRATAGISQPFRKFGEGRKSGLHKGRSDNTSRGDRQQGWREQEGKVFGNARRGTTSHDSDERRRHSPDSRSGRSKPVRVENGRPFRGSSRYEDDAPSRSARPSDARTARHSSERRSSQLGDNWGQVNPASSRRPREVRERWHDEANDKSPEMKSRKPRQDIAASTESSEQRKKFLRQLQLEAEKVMSTFEGDFDDLTNEQLIEVEQRAADVIQQRVGGPAPHSSIFWVSPNLLRQGVQI